MIDNNSTDHKCSQEDIETQRYITENSKPCPRCLVPIQRASGCSQMYCINCMTVFDYNTGLEDTGLVHNPIAFAEALKTPEGRHAIEQNNLRGWIEQQR